MNDAGVGDPNPTATLSAMTIVSRHGDTVFPVFHSIRMRARYHLGSKGQTISTVRSRTARSLFLELQDADLGGVFSRQRLLC
jgi:hypothetical protein